MLGALPPLCLHGVVLERGGTGKAVFGWETNTGIAATLYLSDLAFYDFCVFLELKFLFESLEDIQSNVMTVLKGLLGNVFQQYLQAWQKWKYFEGVTE
jgi:hypothetical protein